MPPPTFAGVAEVTDWENTTGRVMGVYFLEEHRGSLEGSATMVGPGIALCAKHVIEPWLDRLTGLHAMALFIGFSRASPVVWRMTRLTLIDESDLAIVSLSLSQDLPPDGVLWDVASMTTRLPNVGERLTMFGFRAASPAFDLVDQHLHVNAAMLASSGYVTAVYPEGRDRFLIPWPTIEVESDSLGGMSGGPVFDDRGFLLGMVCSSISSDHAGGPTYVALNWPALLRRFDGGWPVEHQQASLHHLAQIGFGCFIERRDALSVMLRDGQQFSTLNYWS